MKNMMKKTLAALIVVSLVLVVATACNKGGGGSSGGSRSSGGSSSISGTFVDVDDPDDIFTFTGRNYTRSYEVEVESGTFTIADGILTAEREDFSPFIFSITDNSTIVLNGFYTYKKK